MVELKIGGFEKLSLLDYPGKISSIVFTTGCNFRCRFCYVPQLVLPEKIKETKEIPENEVFSYLDKNKKLIDAVIVTGGEPTVYEDLPRFLQRIRSRGFLAGLETNGTNPSMLELLIKNHLVDYIAMDIKTRLDFEKYNQMVGGVLSKKMFEDIKQSIRLLLDSKVDYEFRTTLVKNLHSAKDVVEICKSIQGANAYYLQNFRNLGPVVGKEKLLPFSDEEISEIISEGKKYVNILRRR